MIHHSSNPLRAGFAIYMRVENVPGAEAPFFMSIADARIKFQQQKKAAKRRGIEWQLTFEQWLEFWGDDLPRRGRGRHELGMQRPCDSGPYAVGNIRKGTPAENAKTRAAMNVKAVAPRVVSGGGLMRKGWVPQEDEEPNLGYTSVWDIYYS